MKAFSPPKRRTTQEYEKAEKTFEESGNRIIIETFGTETFQKLYMDELNWLPKVAIEVCNELVGKKESKANPDITFHIYIKLAKFYARDGRLKDAIRVLRDALLIRPTNLIANYRIATLLESVGSGDDAISHYQLAEEDQLVSKDLKVYLETQIRRVRTEGPRQKGPWDDSGFQWMTG
jgi:tetratricopeptide (TPR) repeat protein